MSPLAGGVFIAVVGPSGAGKDTVIAYARERLSAESGVTFVRRVITRASHQSSEDHDTLTDEAFREAETAGAFALSWEAHGLRYGIPASADERITAGEVVVANLSRGAIPALRGRYAKVLVVEITAAPAIAPSVWPPEAVSRRQMCWRACHGKRRWSIPEPM